MTIPVPAPFTPVESSWGAAVAEQLNGIEAGAPTVTTDATGLATITFTDPFAAAPMVVVSVAWGASTQQTVQIDAVTATAATVRLFSAGSAAATLNRVIHYIAIGARP